MDVNWTPSSSRSSSSSGVLKLEWKDRRTRAVVDSHTIFPEDDCTYSKVETGNDKDRVYLLQYGNVSDRRFFFWVQDKEEGNLDEENCVKINTFMMDPAEAAAAANGEESPAATRANATTTSSEESKSDDTGAGGAAATSRLEGGLDNDALMQIMQGINADGAAGSGATTNSQGAQVDSLSSILENLGMPQQQQHESAPSSTDDVASNPAPSTSTATPAAPRATGGLTLSDLQGAMAGLATTSPPSSQPLQPSGPPLSEIATTEAIAESGLLENKEVKSKLIALLPEGQRTEEKLMENLGSPQVKQCLTSLTAALQEGESFNSILANFQLDPMDGAAAMMTGNPIQAFLDCVLKSVEREKEAKSNEEGKDGDGDAEMKE
jgi:hypothetical protein